MELKHHIGRRIEAPFIRGEVIEAVPGVSMGWQDLVYYLVLPDKRSCPQRVPHWVREDEEGFE